MNTKPFRSARSELLAALLLGALLALLFALPARAAEPFRLERLDSVSEV